MLRIQKKEFPVFLLLAALILARFIYAAINPVTGDSVFYSLISEFLAKEGRFPSNEVDALGRIIIHPPTIYALSAVFFKAGELFGAGRLFMKMLFPVAGTLTILLTYLLAKELTGNRRTALLSALIFASLPLSLYMSTVIYIDMLMAFFVTLNLYLLLLAIRKNKNRLWAGAAISLVLVAVTKQTGVSLIAAYFVLSFLMWRTGRDFRKPFFAAILASVTLLVWNAYYYQISGRVFLPAGTAFSSESTLLSGISQIISARQAEFMVSEFWVGVPFSYDSIPGFFNMLFGKFAPLMHRAALLFWLALSVLLVVGVFAGMERAKGRLKREEYLFLGRFIACFLGIIFLAPLVGTGIGTHARYLLHILPFLSLYLALSLGPIFERNRLLRLLGVLLVAAFLVQSGAGIMLTSKRISGWNECFDMIKENVQEKNAVFYYGFPDWIIYNTGVKAYGWSDSVQKGDYPNDLSLMYQLRTEEFLDYLTSYKVSFLYIDTAESCGGDPNQFYCADFAKSMENASNARKVATCSNPATGGWGALYHIE